MAKRWYEAGLRFECRRCGQCCRGEPGYVWVSDPEIVAIARLLNLPRDQALARYCRVVFGDVSLIERPNGDCVFWTPEGCRIYPVRPTQC
ncbi:MAG: YkgJ family cysteine cluster protein, partial [Planctomycetota bacterium]